MKFKIFENQNIIYGVTDSSLGSINPFANFDSEKRLVQFINNKKITEKNLVFADQVHKDGVHICSKEDSGSIRLGIDALVTNHKNQILVIKTADCVPILLFDPVKKIVAVIHGGRKSVTAKIISKTIKKMQKSFGILPKNVLTGIGPHIRIESYYLKPKSISQLKNTFWKKYFINKKDRIFFDLTQAILDELTNSSVLKNNIEDCQIDTYKEYKKFFSARRKDENSAIYQQKLPCFASFIGLK